MQQNTKRKKYNRQKRENRYGFLFVAPYVIGFLLFQGIPFLFAIGLSFTDVRFISKMREAKFIGLHNFITMFQDSTTMGALGRTALYSLMYVPMIMVIGFVLAYLVNKGIHCKNIIRSMFFLPYVANMVAVSVVFTLLLGPKGPLIKALLALGVENPPFFLYDMNTALPTVVCIAVWKSIGLNLITYLAALQSVPAELLEAAQIDGASKFKRITHIVLPMVSPTTFFLLISSVITSLQNLTIIQVLTKGGPGKSTTVMSVNIIRTAFTDYQTGYASAQAVVLFIIVMIFTVFQWQGQKKWVNY